MQYAEQRLTGDCTDPAELKERIALNRWRKYLRSPTVRVMTVYTALLGRLRCLAESEAHRNAAEPDSAYSKGGYSKPASADDSINNFNYHGSFSSKCLVGRAVHHLPIVVGTTLVAPATGALHHLAHRR
jgi:hypothetical protein